MPMMPKLWSLNGLSTELNRNIRTLGRALRLVPPDGKVGKNSAWYMETALRALQRHEWIVSGTRQASGRTEAVCGQIEAITVALDAGMARMRAEGDVGRRRQMAAEVGPLVGQLNSALQRSIDLLSEGERQWQGDAVDRAILAPLICGWQLPAA